MATATYSTEDIIEHVTDEEDVISYPNDKVLYEGNEEDLVVCKLIKEVTRLYCIDLLFRYILLTA